MVRAIGCLASFPLLVALACSDDATLGEDESSGSDSSTGTPPTTTVDPDGSDSSQGTSASSLDESSTAAGESSSSGPAVDLCGNGDLDDGEGCDDGNTEDGDACRADCSLAFEVSWTSRYDGPASGSDYALTLSIDDAGNSFVLGRVRTPTGGDDLWLQQYLPDGSEGAALTLDGAFSGDDVGIGIAPTDDGDWLVVGRTEVANDDTDAWVLRIAGDLSEVIWETSLVGPGSVGSNGASTVQPTDDGGLLLGGQVASDTNGTDAWVAHLDGAGATQWEVTFDDELHLDNVATSLLPAGDGDDLVVFGQSDDTYTRGGFAQRYSADGMAQGEPVAFDFTIANAVPDGEGGFVLGGYGDGTNTGLDGVVRRLDGELVEQWSVDYDLALDFDFGARVALDADGRAYLVGQGTRGGEQANAFIAVFDDAGVPVWSDEYNNDELDLGEAWNGVAIDPSGDVIVVGYETILGHQGDAFVRKYHPL